MLFDTLTTTSAEEMLDKFAIKELIEFERFCRDNALWEQMHDCYAAESYVNISWYKGDGHGFVRKSSEMKTKAIHRLNNTLVWLNGAKAIAVCMASIQSRKRFEQEEMDLLTNVKMIFRTVKDETMRWKITRLDVIYEKDSLIPSYPANRKPDFRFRESYANLSRVLEEEGYRIDLNLPGSDRPELVENLLREAQAWLA
ncbi:MAG: SnoaL-like domain-containing protein [Clostridiales bacterium]|nr:SnoaL-like domain-containing protein [Clostridiales bacterium]